MKHRFRWFLIGVVLLLLLSSCTSLTNLVKSQVEGLPTWVYTPVTSANKRAFVGKGSAQLLFNGKSITEEQARSNAKIIAYEQILDQLSEFVGEPVRDTYYRELTTTDAIEAFGLEIVNEYSKSDLRTPAQFYLLATADTAKLESKRTSVYNAMLKRDKDIEALIREADKAYRSNNDTKAIKLYFDAVLIASEGPVAKKYEPETLLAKSITFINALRFSLTKSDPFKATATVQLQRKSRLLSPKVLNAPIVAEFAALNSLGRRYADSLLFNTASEGSIQFVPYNYSLEGSGSIRFAVDFSSSLLELEKQVPPETLAPLYEALQRHGIEYAYSLVSSIASKTLVADVREYEYAGSLRTSKEALSALIDLYKGRGVPILPLSLEQDEMPELYDEVRLVVPEANVVLLGKAGVVDETQIGDQNVVVVTGSIQLWNIDKRSLVADTLEVEAVAYDPLLEEAKKEAFRRFGQISSSLLFSSFF